MGAVALAVGRFLPALTKGARWPYRLLGVGYALLSVAVLLIGAWRQRRASSALGRGSYEELSSPLVSWLTAGGVACPWRRWCWWRPPSERRSRWASPGLGDAHRV